jgi:hypothetical protein
MKRNTNFGSVKLGSETGRLVRGMRGAAAQIAAVAHCDHAYVSRVLSGKKPPSKKFLLALETVLQGAQLQVWRAIVQHEHPEITWQHIQVVRESLQSSSS